MRRPRLTEFALAALIVTAAVARIAAPGSAGAYTFPVTHQGGPRATATFVEDHGGWHAGIDLPLTDGALRVYAATAETLFHAFPLSFEDVRVELNDNSTIVGPWSLELSSTSQKYMLDILRVRRVTIGKPEISYQVSHVIETQPGIALDGVELVPGLPSLADSLVDGDSLAVDYAYYRGRIFQTAHLSAVGNEFHYYAHIDKIHDYVAWNTYPATPQNRYYGVNSVIPPGRWAFGLDEGESFAEIEQDNDFGSEPHHLHFTTTEQFQFPLGATNPLSNPGFGVDDPQGNRPFVRSLVLLSSLNFSAFPDQRVYGGVDILVESRDDMGSPEAADDGDGGENTIREAGAYNAGYWVTADSADGEDVGTAVAPNTMFAGPGKDTITGADALQIVLPPLAPYRVDINTNYHLIVSHVEEDAGRRWHTAARRGGALNDGSDAPPARVNSEARFGDGRYTVHARARDVVAWGAERDSFVVVDNFRPFVRKVVVRDDSGELYAGEWSFDGMNLVFAHADPDDGLKDDQGRKRCADGSSDVVIDVTFSEGMKEAFLATVLPLGYRPTLRRQTPDQDSLWTATIPKAKLSGTRDRAGRQTIEIFGTDWGDNDLRRIDGPDPFPATDNARLLSVMQGQGGTDRLHRFALCQELALVVDVTGSMYDEIETVREAMADVIDFNASDPDRYVAYNIVTFQDEVDFQRETKDPDEARTVIGFLQAQFGGDCPEASVAALDSLRTMMPRGGVAILATDADPREGRPRLEAMKAALRALDIEVNTLLSGDCGGDPGALAEGLGPDALVRLSRDNGAPPGGPASPAPPQLTASIHARVAFQEVARATGGLFINTLPTIDLIAATRTILLRYGIGSLLTQRSLIRPAPDMAAVPIPVDSTCAELLVVLNYTFGDQTSLVVRRPTGQVVAFSDPDAEVAFAPAIAVLRIQAPMPGAWTAEVTTTAGTGAFEVTAHAASPRRARLGGLPAVRAGTTTPIVVTLEGTGTPTAFRLLGSDGTPELALTLFDDGLHGDGEADDRTWGGVATPGNVGDYRVAVDGVDGGDLFTRETGQTIVVAVPEMAAADTLDFGTLAVGASTTRRLGIVNRGRAPLLVTGATAGHASFTAGVLPFTVPPGGSLPLPVTWTPTGPGEMAVALSIVSDDPGAPLWTTILVGRAVPPAFLTHAPDTLVVSLPQGDSADVALIVRNTGTGPTTLVVTDPAGGCLPGSPAYSFRTSFGDVPGVPFRWEELGPGAMTLEHFPVNGAFGPFPIGFDFPFFGGSATEFYVSANGHVTLGQLPFLGIPPFGPCPPVGYLAPWIAAFWRELSLNAGGRVRWQADAERLVIEYEEVRAPDQLATETPLNCQIVLRRDGSIDLNYESVPPPSLFGYGIVGIGSGANLEYLAPSCQIPNVPRERTSLHFWRDTPWLTTASIGDSLAAGDSVAITLRVDTRAPGTTPGDICPATLVLLNDTPGGSRREIAVRLEIEESPHALAGRITALEDGSPVAAAIVMATGPYGSYRDTTEANGDYRLESLAIGDYTMTVDSPLFLAPPPLLFRVPEDTVRDVALTRPILTLEPAQLTFTAGAGDSICLPLVVRNTGTAALELTGSRRREIAAPASGGPEGAGSGPEYERVLDDPTGDSGGPDLVALDAVVSGGAMHFRLTLSDPYSAKPPTLYLSLDTDRNPATGANPPAFGLGLTTQDLGAEYELVIENVCGGYGTIRLADTGEFTGSFFLNIESEYSVSFAIPLEHIGNDDGVVDVAVTSIPGICDGGSTRPGGPPEVSNASGAAGAGGPGTTDWMPEVGHGTVGACGWLSFLPREALVAPGDSVTLAVCVDARGLEAATYSCALTLESNDPRRPLAELPVTLTVSGTSAAPTPDVRPGVPHFALRQNEPNPVSRITRIRFELPRDERVRLSLFDLSGRLVWRALDEFREAGVHEVALDARGRLAGGLYFYRLEAGARVATRKMLVVDAGR